MDVRKILAQYSYKYEGDWNKICKAIINKESIENINIHEKYITIFDDEYPESLKKLRFPPWVLFYKGDISLLKKECISIVGSRNACNYGEDITRKIVNSNKNKVIVSGLAKGIDAIAHDEAIKCTKTIAVIGCGLNHVYPLENIKLYKIIEKDHLIISEYPCFTKVKKYHFPFRNRIIAALSEKLFVTQARVKSGTMLTVNEALNLSKEVYVVPYPLFLKEGEGCNLLISEGANIILEIN